MQQRTSRDPSKSSSAGSQQGASGTSLLDIPNRDSTASASSSSKRTQPTPKQDYLRRTSSMPHDSLQAQGEYYHTYLCLDKILEAQHPVSGYPGGAPASISTTRVAAGPSSPAEGPPAQLVHGSALLPSSLYHSVGSSEAKAASPLVPGTKLSGCPGGTTAQHVDSAKIPRTPLHHDDTAATAGAAGSSAPQLPQGVQTSEDAGSIPHQVTQTSNASRPPAHEEMLFIVIHQTYELWFKQILHELEAVHEIFSRTCVPENSICDVCNMLYRVTRIQEVLIQQITVLETMTPMAFLEFRDYLVPASGFQSWQFRMIEIALGIPLARRKYGTEAFLKGVFQKQHLEMLEKWSERPSLADLVERWLERLPFYQTEEYDFWQEFKVAVDDMCDNDEALVNKVLAEEKREVELKAIRSVRSSFASLLDPDMHKEMMSRKVRRWSQKATLAALFIFLYRNEPMLSNPFRLLNLLMEIDENFTIWRTRHASMAHRMIGIKIGTGGTSGVEYLNRAATENKAFKDLWSLSTYLVPASALPELPRDLRYRIGFLHDYLVNEAPSPQFSPLVNCKNLRRMTEQEDSAPSRPGGGGSVEFSPSSREFRLEEKVDHAGNKELLQPKSGFLEDSAEPAPGLGESENDELANMGGCPFRRY
ncbi:unnamed protein product [Amoebophrya sp. A120]|nr:unnamed protein product [Amoebophrya sp. A120]|eukprot:GSA120T00015082001.1